MHLKSPKIWGKLPLNTPRKGPTTACFSEVVEINAIKLHPKVPNTALICGGQKKGATHT